MPGASDGLMMEIQMVIREDDEEAYADQAAQPGDAIVLMGGSKQTPRSNKASSPKQQQGPDLRMHFLDLDPLSDSSHPMGTSRQQNMASPCQRDERCRNRYILSIVQDEQPMCMGT